MGRRLAESLPACAPPLRSRRRSPRLRPGQALFRRTRRNPRLDDLQPAGLVRHQPGRLGVAAAQSPEVVLSCEAAAGLSLGEYTAMVFAGIMDFEDGLTLVQQRGAAMQEAADATPSGMVTILGLERVQVEALCAQGPRRRNPRNRQPPLPGNDRHFRDECGLRAGGRDGPAVRGDEGGSLGRGRGLSHHDHAAGRPTLRRRLGRSPLAPAEHPSRFQRQRPIARRPRGHPPPDGQANPSAGPLGRLDAEAPATGLRPVLRDRAGPCASRLERVEVYRYRAWHADLVGPGVPLP